jgi:hypothetical protein
LTKAAQDIVFYFHHGYIAYLFRTWSLNHPKAKIPHLDMALNDLAEFDTVGKVLEYERVCVTYDNLSSYQSKHHGMRPVAAKVEPILPKLPAGAEPSGAQNQKETTVEGPSLTKEQSQEAPTAQTPGDYRNEGPVSHGIGSRQVMSSLGVLTVATVLCLVL